MALISEPTIQIEIDPRSPSLSAGTYPNANDLALASLSNGNFVTAWTTEANYVGYNVLFEPEDYGLFVQVLNSNLGQSSGELPPEIRTLT